MLKRIICLAILIVTATQAVYAQTVEQMTGKVIDKLNIEYTQSDDVLKYYKDWSKISHGYKVAVATALSSGVLVPKNRIISPHSENPEDLIRGVINYCIKNKNYKISSAPFKLFSIDGALVLPSTLLLNVDALNEGENYCAVISKQNEVLIAWKPTEIKAPIIMRGTLYFKEGDMAVLSSLSRYSFGQWIEISLGEYIEAYFADNASIFKDGKMLTDSEINANYLDREIYMFCDYQNENIKVLGAVTNEN